MFRLFIWDLDNTLVGTSPLLWGAFSWIAEKYAGRKMTPAEIVGLYGPPEDQVIEKIVGREKKEEALQEFYSFYEKKHQDLVEVFSPVLEAITFLRSRQVKQALFTSKGRKSAMMTLEKLDLERLFDFVLCGDEVEHAKPSPEGVWRILSFFGVKPEEAVYIGDSPLDAKAARGARVPFIMVLWDSFHRERMDEVQAYRLFAKPEDFLNWVRETYQ
ncbi:MAG: HAD family hydrolase [Candidatus Caldatribacteriaceae bacterium]